MGTPKKVPLILGNPKPYTSPIEPYIAPINPSKGTPNFGKPPKWGSRRQSQLDLKLSDLSQKQIQDWALRVKGFKGLGVKDLGLKGLGFEGLGFEGLGFRGLGLGGGIWE